MATRSLSIRSCPKRFPEKVSALMDSVDQRPLLTLDLECLQSLVFLTMPTGSQNPTTGTGQWILQNETYRRWTTECGSLWLKERLDVGKSTIMRYMVNQAMKQGSETQTVVLSFFCHHGLDLQCSSTGIFRLLLHQILQVEQGFLDQFIVDSQFVNRCKNSGEPGVKWNWDDGTLRMSLEQCIRQLVSDRSVHVYIDALDECDDDTIKAVVEFFHGLSSSLNDHFGICFASRPYREAGKPVLYTTQYRSAIELQELNQPDIEAYLNDEFLPLEGDASVDDIQRVKNHLSKRASGVFRWIAFVAKDAVGWLSEESVDYTIAMIDNLSTYLNELYSRAMQKIIRDEEVEVAFQIFELLTFTPKLIPVEDLRYSVCVSSGDEPKTLKALQRNKRHWVDEDDKFIKRAFRLSGGMVRVVEMPALSKFLYAFAEPLIPVVKQHLQQYPDGSTPLVLEDTAHVINSLELRGQIAGFIKHLQFDHECIVS